MPREINRRSLPSNKNIAAQMFMSLPFTYFVLPSSPVTSHLFTFLIPNEVKMNACTKRDKSCNLDLCTDKIPIRSHVFICCEFFFLGDDDLKHMSCHYLSPSTQFSQDLVQHNMLFSLMLMFIIVIASTYYMFLKMFLNIEIK